MAQLLPSLRAPPIVLLTICCCFLVSAADIGSYSRELSTSIGSSSSRAVLFGVRGGAFFGFGRRQTNNGGGDDDDDNSNKNNNNSSNNDSPKRFPPMSQEEIEEKLHIPVFGLTDANGNGVIMSDNGNNIFHFFFSKHMADAALRAVTAANSEAPELRVSAFDLGKCWFKLIKGDKMFKLQTYGGKRVNNEDDSTIKPVQFRLVPNSKDLMGARILTGLKPGDVEQLKDAIETPDAPKAVSIIQKASNEANGFTNAFNEIPCFAIAQMRVRKKNENGEPVGEPMLPFHLSSKTMSDTWTEFTHHSPEFEDAEATLQLVELHKMIEMMQNESDFDFRNIVFIVPTYDKDEPHNEDSDDDSDDDSGGGDDGIRADCRNYNEYDTEPYVSMEVFANAPGYNSLVQV
jgi:hypothetical protein